jgi:hypothetical protein
MAASRSLCLLALLAASARADVFLHNPPGSNGRNRERSDTRNNGDRLFDSQNSGDGSYPWRGDATAKAVGVHWRAMARGAPTSRAAARSNPTH